jgi:TetR/AcrR family transcriptional regulator
MTSPTTTYERLSPGPGKSAAEVDAHQRTRIHGAMVDLAAESGYAAVTMREITQVSGVSSRAFYEHFSGKEDCFFDAYDRIVHRIIKRIITARAGEQGSRRRIRLAFREFAQELEREPSAARLALIEIYRAGPEGLRRARRAEGLLEAIVAEGFGHLNDQNLAQAMVIDGITVGVIGAARSTVINDFAVSGAELGDGLASWALSFSQEAIAELGRLDRQAVSAHNQSKAKPVWPSSRAHSSRTDSRDLILSAITKLAALVDYEHLSVQLIQKAAGLSRKDFKSHFSSIDDCLFSAFEYRVSCVLSDARDLEVLESSWEEQRYLSIVSLCLQIEGDHLLHRLCLLALRATGAGMLSCFENIQSEIAGLIYSFAPRACGPSNKVTADASASAVWGIILRQLGREYGERFPACVATLAFLALAPDVGATGAISAIHRAQGEALN